MSSQSHSVLTLTVVASGAIVANRFVSPMGDQAGDGENALGVARFTVADNKPVAVDMLGTTVVEAGAAISAGALVQSNAEGKAITKAAGVSVGRMAPGQGASIAGRPVEIILIPN